MAIVIQSDCVISDTFDIENLHFDIDTCINKHSGMIGDQKWLGVIDL